MKKEEEPEENVNLLEDDNAIITTMEELEAYHVIKAILSEYCDLNRIYYKDTISYFGVLYDNKVTKWICRIYLKENVKYIIIPDKDRNEIRYDIKQINDLYKYKNQLIGRLNEFLKILVNN